MASGERTSTPKPDTAARRGGKRLRSAIGSDSSVDGELSYLDLDTGRVLSASRTDNISMSTNLYDTIMSKLLSFEKCFSKLEKLDKLDSIETCVTSMSLKISDFEHRLVNSEKTTIDLVQSVSFMSEQYDSLSVKCDQNNSHITKCDSDLHSLKQENDELRSTLNSLNELNKSLKEDMLDLKCRSMRDNLVFTNIPENFKTGDGGRRYENTEQELSTFLLNKLNISGVQFERVHRITPAKSRSQGPQNPRPIVAKFTLFKERERVRHASYKLAGTRYGINEQYPEEIEQTRRKLYPVLRQLRRQNERAVLIKDKLLVNGREVRPDDLPAYTRQPTAVGSRPQASSARTDGPPSTQNTRL